MHLVHDDIPMQHTPDIVKAPAQDAATGAGTVKHAGASQQGQVHGPPTEEDDARLRQQCLRQVEFWFSDSNLPYDEFLWKLHAASDAHWVLLDTVARFKRMHKFERYGRDWLADVLRSSKAVEVNDTGRQIRRIEPVVDRGEEQWNRTAFIGGFESGTLQADIEAFIEPFGPVLAVRMRRYEDAPWAKTKSPRLHEFKGSVWVEFPSAGDMKKFVAMEPKPMWKEKELAISTKEMYYADKWAKRGFPKSTLDKMRRCNATDRCFTSFYAFNADGTPKDPAKEPQKRELRILFMGQRLRTWRLGEGVDLPDGAPKLNPDEWQFVKRKDVQHIKGATLLVTVEHPSRCDGNIFKATRDHIARLRIRPLPSIVRQTTGSAVFCFERPVSDETFARIRARVTTTYNRKLEWTRLGFEAEHILQYARANATARGELGGYPDTTVDSKKARGKQAKKLKKMLRSAARMNKGPTTFDDQIEKTLAQWRGLQEKVMGQQAAKEQMPSSGAYPAQPVAGPSNLKRKRDENESMEHGVTQTSPKKAKNGMIPFVSLEMTKAEGKRKRVEEEEEEEEEGLSASPSKRARAAEPVDA
ncbi:hypothetical protein EXIGLDRAFT_833018 [Exidia glandulosa HHB12029]|uniref:HTH La-type RNA-binding domain-containing protein n=1 Tax=Exidia glandulosa HHB12029 TaxID=1314781 RepID=A0A165L447_EXIGL|nr:hypothetical protein EXIGLDRAFT_833018 [Exidia glandulosa HHB12029]